MLPRKTLLPICTALLAFASLAPASAEIGPCKPDGDTGMICGEGNGGARVVEGTISPSKRLALAWRFADNPPTEAPSDTQPIEDLVIRLRDGAILAKQEGEFWEIPNVGRVNRVFEAATWSPNSRLMIETIHYRFDTGTMDVYAFDAHDKVTGPLSLFKIVEPAVRARLKQRVKDDKLYVFSASFGPHNITIDDNGLVHASVTMWVPKMGPEAHYRVTLQVTRKDGDLGARILSIAPSREKS
jgi:hypothetical protein